MAGVNEAPGEKLSLTFNRIEDVSQIVPICSMILKKEKGVKPISELSVCLDYSVCRRESWEIKGVGRDRHWEKHRELQSCLMAKSPEWRAPPWWLGHIWPSSSLITLLWWRWPLVWVRRLQLLLMNPLAAIFEVRSSLATTLLLVKSTVLQPNTSFGLFWHKAI